jgi:hypothetical protein
MSTDETITVTRAEWDGVMARLEALESQSALRRQGSADAPEAPQDGTTAPVRVGRRRALAGMAGAAAAGVAGAVVSGTPAAAADGDTLRAGQQVVSVLSTSIRNSTAARQYGFGVIDTTQAAIAGRPALYGHAANNAFSTGVFAHGEGIADGLRATSEASFAVTATTASPSFPAIRAYGAAGGPALVLWTNGNHLLLEQGSRTDPPQRSTFNRAGSIAMVSGGDLWLCTVSGTPGTWRKLAGPATAGALHVLPSPVRVYDSRPGTQPAVGVKAPLPAGGTRPLDLKANSSGVPAGATAALLTVLLVNATAGAGHFTVWSAGQPKPQANTVVWGGDAGRFSATAVTALDAQARVQVSASLPTHLVLDVVGYYR